MQTGQHPAVHINVPCSPYIACSTPHSTRLLTGDASQQYKQSRARKRERERACEGRDAALPASQPTLLILSLVRPGALHPRRILVSTIASNLHRRRFSPSCTHTTPTHRHASRPQTTQHAFGFRMTTYTDCGAKRPSPASAPITLARPCFAARRQQQAQIVHAASVPVPVLIHRRPPVARAHVRGRGRDAVETASLVASMALMPKGRQSMGKPSPRNRRITASTPHQHRASALCPSAYRTSPTPRPPRP